MARRSLGYCAYCHRDLVKPTSRSTCAFTKDHVMPKCVGGQKKVRCCRQCTQLKGDLHPSVWRWFTEAHPAWWRTFRTAADVRAVCRIRFGEMCSVTVVGRASRAAFDRFDGGEELGTRGGVR